jgi:hypothetical protein
MGELLMSDQADPAASDATEQPAKPTVQTPSPLMSAVIRQMNDEGGGQEDEQPDQQEPKEPTQPERKDREDTKPTVPGDAKAAPPTDKTKPAEAVPTEWPDSAKARVAEEADKRRRAIAGKTEAENKVAELEGKVTDLMSQLGQVQRPILPDNPLSDVHDEASLQKAEKQYEKLLEFAERNRGGAWDVTTGRNADGSPKQEDFTEQQITDMKLDAENALRKLIPQRRQYLTARTQMDSAAKQVYPELEDPQSQWSQEAAAILRIVPELERVPDVLVWIGHALHRRDEFVASMAKDNNGATLPANNDARRIVDNVRQAKAPSVPADRGFTTTRDADVETARKRMKADGGEEATEDFIAATLERGRRRRMASAPVR